MSREIKFRAWDSVDKVMRVVKEVDFRIGSIDVEPIEGTPECWELYDPVLFKGQFELMQYTGLKDKNDVEIYEGDLVKVTSDFEFGWEVVSEVVWGIESPLYGNYPAFCIPKLESEANSFSEVFDSGNYDILVIGNIYENPELLKER